MKVFNLSLQDACVDDGGRDSNTKKKKRDTGRYELLKSSIIIFITERIVVCVI